MRTSKSTPVTAAPDFVDHSPKGPQTGSFIVKKTLHIDGPTIGFMGSVQNKQFAEQQIVLSVIEKHHMRHRKVVSKFGEPVKYGESTSVELVEDSRRKLTIPAGHAFVRLNLESGEPPSFFIADVIDGAPTDEKLPPRVVQLRVYNSGRIEITAYSAQGKARIVRVSPEELRVLA